jgi:hypothetical protein
LCRFPYRFLIACCVVSQGAFVQGGHVPPRRGFATPRADLITIVQQLPHLPRARVAEATLDMQAAALKRGFLLAEGRDDTRRGPSGRITGEREEMRREERDAYNDARGCTEKAMSA